MSKYIIYKQVTSSKCIAVRKVVTPLRELTCHMGSHSVTCHPAEVIFRKRAQWSAKPNLRRRDIIGTASACAAGSMKLSGCPSVRPSVRSSHHSLRRVCCCGPGRQDISIGCCTAGGSGVVLKRSGGRLIFETI